MSKADRLRQARIDAGYSSASEAARAFGFKIPTLTSHENDTRDFDDKTARQYARAFRVSVEWLVFGRGDRSPPQQARLVGYVGAGSEAHYYGDGHNLNEFVPMPPGGTDTTVAVEIRGESLGPLFNRWLVYYDDVHTPPHDGLLRKLCVVGLDDGRVLVKQLLKGSSPGFWHLVSQTEGVIENARISWAAEVKAIVPR